jgi:hypothetical protein
MLRALALLLLVVVLVGMGLFALQNQGTFTSHLLTFSWQGTPVWAPGAAAGLAVLLVCTLYGLAAGAGWRIRHRRLSRDFDEHQAAADHLQRENLELRERVAGLRAGGDRGPAGEP